jgi:hypothetical protein
VAHSWLVAAQQHNSMCETSQRERACVGVGYTGAWTLATHQGSRQLHVIPQKGEPKPSAAHIHNQPDELMHTRSDTARQFKTAAEGSPNHSDARCTRCQPHQPTCAS